MESTQNEILLIMPSVAEQECPLQKILKKNSVGFIHVNNFSDGIQLALQSCFDMIICENNGFGYNGFNLYETITPVISKKNIPFILILNEFRKKDILIGLEMGIDNFIFAPYDEIEIINKIRLQLKKSKTVKDKSCIIFHENFETTPVAKFVSDNDRIVRVNKEFTKITGISNEMTTMPLIAEILNFSNNEINELNYSKLMNGLLIHCFFESIPLISNKDASFNIQLVFHSCFDKRNFVGEIVPHIQSDNRRVRKSDTQIANGVNENYGNEKTNDLMILTEREQEVLNLSVQGLAIKQIAEILKLSDRTVEKHRSNIMEKTNSHSILEAIHFISTKKGS